MPDLPTLDKVEKRERIIQAALKVFHEKGYNRVGLEEIAREAGLAKGTLYLYFTGKEDLIAAAVNYVIESLQQTLTAAIDETRDPFQILESIATAQMEVLARNRSFFGLFFLLSAPRLIRSRRQLFERVMGSHEALMKVVVDLLQKAQLGGQLRPHLDPRDLAFLYSGMLSSAIHRLDQNRSAGKPDIGKTVQIMMDVFRNGVTPRRESA